MSDLPPTSSDEPQDDSEPSVEGSREGDAWGERSRDPLSAFEAAASAARPARDDDPRENPSDRGDSVADTRADLRPASPYSDPYTDVPASLELAYSESDLGLSEHAYERAFPYEQRQRHAAGRRARRIGRELVETVILAVLIFFAVKAVIQNFRVEGRSMEPSLENQEYLLVNKAIYFRMDMDRVHRFLPFVPGDNGEDRHLFRAPRRGDVIVFRFHLDPSRDFIKRVIGVPGDTVEVRDGTVFINGAPLKEDYISDTPNYTYGPKTVPPGHYFVLGDNRRNSFDSHAWGSSCPAEQECDFLPEENIIGQAWLRYWPFDQLGLVNNESLKPSAP